MSRKRKKKSPLRNEFTDALNVEMAERKIIERTQKETEDKKTETVENATVEVAAVSLEKVEIEKSAVEKVEVEKISIEKNEPVEPVKKVVEIEKVAAAVEETPKIEIVEVKVDKKLEERILKEANNTFLDVKTPEKKSPKIEKPRKSIFRSKGMQRWEEGKFEEKAPPPKFEPEPQIEMPHKMSRPEKFGGIMSVVMLVYAFANLDKPLFFLALSMFAHFLSYSIASVFGKHAAAVQNAIHTFSIVIFFGAIMFLFTD